MRKLFEPNTRAIGRPPGPTKCDAVPDSLVDGTPSDLRDDLVRLLGKKQVFHRVIDLVRYAADASPYRLLPKAVVLQRNMDDVANILAYCRELSRVVVHPTCSMNHLGISAHLSKIASSFAVEAEVPVGDTCRGTAGDGGLLHPELVMSATRDTKAVLDTRPADAYISANRTCEMGLLHARGRPYRSFVFLREELGRPERPSRFNNQDIDAAIPIMS